MTVKEFKANPDLVKEMRKILENSTLRLYLEAMDEEAPVKYSPPEDITPHRAQILFGEVIGWAAYGKTLLSGGQQPPVPATEPDQSYLTPEEPPEE